MTRTLSSFFLLALLSTIALAGCTGEDSGSSSSSSGGGGDASSGGAASSAGGDSSGGGMSSSRATTSSSRPRSSSATTSSSSSSSSGGSTSGSTGGSTGAAPYQGTQEAGVTCASQLCDPATTNLCCVPLTGDGACEAGTTCSGFGFTIACDGPEDCNHDTQVCCADGLATTCMETAACAGAGSIGELSRVCGQDADCPAGAGCCTLSGFVADLLTSVDFGTCVLGGCGGGTSSSSSGGVTSSSAGGTSSAATSAAATSAGGSSSAAGASSAAGNSSSAGASSSAAATSVGGSSGPASSSAVPSSG